MIAGILGKLGRGKTCLLTALAYFNYKFGSLYVKSLLYPRLFNLSNSHEIYANYHLKFPYKPVTCYDELDDMKSGSAFLDEFWVWADSRMSMTNKNKSVSMLALKSRKRDLDIYYSAQNWSRIDKRIRNITDILIMPDYDMRTGIISVDVCEPLEKYKEVIKSFKISAKPFFSMYDTTQEIGELDNDEDD